MSNNTLSKDYKACEKIIKENSKTFYKAFSTLPLEKRQALYAVYAFCRIADDTMDERQDVSELQAFEQQFQDMLNQEPVEGFLWRALQDVFNTYPMDPMPFFDMIKGQRMDLGKVRYASLDALLGYCYHVASTVGLMLNPILTDEPEAYKDAAIHLGYAMQITNILRDVGEDLARDRIYLPQALMEKHGVSEQALHEHKMSFNFISLFRELEAFAREEYQKALPILVKYPQDVKLQLIAASKLYEAILDACVQADYDVFTKRNKVSSKEKLAIVQTIKEVYQ